MNFLLRVKSSGIIEVISILFVAFLIRTFGYGLYRVPTESMEKTMLPGEFFFSNKAGLLFSKPERGDVVVFNDPLYVYSQSELMKKFENYMWGPENWSKRVIGIPGDTIEGLIERGKPVIYRNGKRLLEAYVDQYPYVWNDLDVFSITLKSGQYWVMGDNRSNSYDSRSFGPLDGRMIHGKIVYRLFSIERPGAWTLLDMIAHPIRWCKSVRWQRCMEKIV